VVVYLLVSRHFRVRIYGNFLPSMCLQSIAPAWSCPLNRAVYSTSHSVWSVYRVSRVDRVISTVYPL